MEFSLLTYLYLILFAHYCCCIICYCTIYSMENYVEVHEVTWFKAWSEWFKPTWMTLNCEVLLTKWGKFRKRTFSVTVTASSTTRADTSLELPLSTSNKFLSWCEYLSFSCHKCWHKRLILISCYNYTYNCIYFLFDRNTLPLISEIHYSEEQAK